MKEVVAKRYVKALISVATAGEFDAVAADLKAIVAAFNHPKLSLIISSPSHSASQKVEFIKALIGDISAKTDRFLTILAAKKRLDFIPEISTEIERQRALRDGKFIGLITSDSQISSEQIGKIADGFSKKIGANIEFESRIGEGSGIKIEVEGLGVEVAISTERLKAQMAQYILKAI